MANSLSKDQMVDNLEQWSDNNARRETISRAELVTLCDMLDVTVPQWLTNDARFRVGRGLYRLPKLSDLEKSAKKEKVKKTFNDFRMPVAPVDVFNPPIAMVGASVHALNAPQRLSMNVMVSGLEENSSVPEAYENYTPFGVFAQIKQIVASRQFFPTFITGPSGNGKTMAVEQACAKAGREFVPVSMTEETDEGDLLGNYVLLNGSMAWRDGPITIAARRGAVCLIDEIDYGSKNLSCLQRVLEGKPFLLKKKNEMVVPAPGFNIFATANTKGKGSDSGRYMYTNILNEAFLERFPVTLEQNWPSIKIETQIITGELAKLGCTDEKLVASLVDWADIIRRSFNDGAVEEVISTRRLVHIVKAYAIFRDIKEAIQTCIARFDEETKMSFLDLYSKIENPSTPEES